MRKIFGFAILIIMLFSAFTIEVSAENDESAKLSAESIIKATKLTTSPDNTEILEPSDMADSSQPYEHEEFYNGFVKINGKKYYYKDNVLVRNQFVEYRGKTYVLKKDGTLYSNEVFKYKGVRYVADKNGALYKDEKWRIVKTSDGKFHYVMANGKLYVPKKRTIVKWRGVLPNGDIKVKSQGPFWINGERYFANNKGVIYHGKRCIVKYAGKKFAIRMNGKFFRNEVCLINGKYYVTNDKGALYLGKNWRVVKTKDGKLHYVSASGGLYRPKSLTVVNWRGVNKDGNIMVYSDGFFNYNGKKFLADNNGVIYHGKVRLVTVNGKRYGLNSNGELFVNQHFTVDGKECFAQLNGEVLILEKSKKLNVELISQFPQLPTGCEITSVTQMIRYSGKNVDKGILAKEMPYHPSDPNKGYVGDPFTRGGWTIYPDALENLVRKYTGSFKNMTNCGVTDIKWQITKNRPVVVWVGNFNGWNLHCVIITGYDENNFYYNDCSSNQKTSISIDSFLNHWKVYGNKALSY